MTGWAFCLTASVMPCFADTLVGICTAALLIYCTESVRNQEPGGKLSPILRLFQARWTVFLGTMSYSLYLLHAPLLAIFYFGLSALNVSAGRSVLALCFAGVPLSVLLCYGFHRTFERPFMSHSGEKAAEKSRKEDSDGWPMIRAYKSL